MVPLTAGAGGIVVDDLAFGVGSTPVTMTGIPALLLYASCGLAARRADHALWSAVGWSANTSNLTGAHT